MPEELSRIDALRGLALLQQELLRFALYVANHGPAVFEGQTVSSTLRDGQRRTSSLLAMAAGQSLNTVIRMAKLRGISVRDTGSGAECT
jgi:hypothetical protein